MIQSTAERVDSTGLRYAVRNGQLQVCYPHRRDDPGAWGSWFAIGPIPAEYWVSAPNPITRERTALWADLLGIQRAAS